MIPIAIFLSTLACYFPFQYTNLCSEVKWVWSWSNSIFIFLCDCQCWIYLCWCPGLGWDLGHQCHNRSVLCAWASHAGSRGLLNGPRGPGENSWWESRGFPPGTWALGPTGPLVNPALLIAYTIYSITIYNRLNVICQLVSKIQAAEGPMWKQ